MNKKIASILSSLETVGIAIVRLSKRVQGTIMECLTRIWSWAKLNGLSFLTGLLTSGLTISILANNKGCNYIVYDTKMIPRVTDSIYLKLPCPELKSDSVQITIINHDTTLIVEGTGHEGQHAKVAIDFLSSANSWAYASDIYTTGGDNINNVLNEYFHSEGAIARMKIAKGIIAVGTASYEGEAGSELNRAQRRLLAIQRNVELYTDGLPIYTLNLGKFEVEASGDSYFQRRVILIRILSKDEHMNCASLEDALRDAFRKALNQGLHLELLNYGYFEFGCLDKIIQQ